MTARIIYFHGQPGGPAELDLVGAGALAADCGVQAPDRSTEDAGLGFAGRINAVAAGLASGPGQGQGQGRLQLVGFSLGAFVAMEVALSLLETAPELEVSLDLISPAGPLALGDFLPRMAGGTVFRLARDQPSGFAAATRVQGVVAAFAPRWMIGQVLASAAGGDVALTSDPVFRRAAGELLRRALARGARTYRQDISAYVSQSPARLGRLNRPVRIWQGRADNWTPPEMAESLAGILPDVRGFRMFDGLSHYSTLRDALPLALQDCRA